MQSERILGEECDESKGEHRLPVLEWFYPCLEGPEGGDVAIAVMAMPSQDVSSTSPTSGESFAMVCAPRPVPPTPPIPLVLTPTPPALCDPNMLDDDDEEEEGVVDVDMSTEAGVLKSSMPPRRAPPPPPPPPPPPLPLALLRVLVLLTSSLGVVRRSPAWELLAESMDASRLRLCDRGVRPLPLPPLLKMTVSADSPGAEGAAGAEGADMVSVMLVSWALPKSDSGRHCFEEDCPREARE